MMQQSPLMMLLIHANRTSGLTEGSAAAEPVRILRIEEKAVRATLIILGDRRRPTIDTRAQVVEIAIPTATCSGKEYRPTIRTCTSTTVHSIPDRPCRTFQ